MKLILLHDSLLKSIKSFRKVAQPDTGYALAQLPPSPLPAQIYERTATLSVGNLSTQKIKLK